MSGEPLILAGTVKLDATGAGQVTLSPPDTIPGWVVTLTSVHVDRTSPEPTFRLYRDHVAPENFLEGSYSGALDSSASILRVHPGESLVGAWEGGAPGALAFLRCTGEVA